MEKQQNWSSEMYLGLEVHVTVLQKEDASHLWDYTVRVSEPGMDTSAEGELTAASGDDADYGSADAALAAGFARGYKLVDQIRQS